MDGYFIFNRLDTGQFFISKLYSTELHPIDWATAEAIPDDTLAVFVSNRQLWLMGEWSLEAWYDSGDPDFPFTRISGAVVDIGILHRDAVSKVASNLIFVGNNRRVYMMSGYTPVAISTSPVELLIDKANEVKSFSFFNNGHYFYVLTLDNITVVYDVLTKLWHTRRSCNTGGEWAIEGAINLHDATELYGFTENKIAKLSTTILTEDGNMIIKEAVSVPFNSGVNRFVLSEMQLDMEVAVGDANAEVKLQISGDGGRNWGNEYPAFTGEVGHHRQRVRWTRLGQYRDCIAKIKFTEPIDVRISGLYARIA
jgi:hypothetical protein